MSETAYLLVFVEKATLKTVSACIKGERHVTMNQDYAALVLHEVTDENFDRAQRKLRNTVMSGRHYDWLKPIWEDSTPFR